MGYYVNPELETKEQFLVREGKEVPTEWMTYNKFNNDSLIVCLVDNGLFRAAIICHSEGEYAYVRDNPDYRPKTYYLVDREKLEPYLI